MRDNITKKLVKTAVIAAIYTILTVILAPISYGPVQFRISEILVLLAVIDPFYIVGLTVGCLIANIFGGYGLMDIVFGTVATFLSVTGVYLTGKYIKNKKISLVLASLWPTIFNGLIIGWMLNIVADLPMVLSMIQVGVGEFVVVTLVGVPVFRLIENKYKDRLALE
ncbi:MAG: QueT transporter family protein [Clostridium sp.]|uniref:QueT transporter family protein n=1 Tax=Clostridium sp. TaxID=1506 RepID=UPI0029078C8B|nr:QueT transporter family protein [Clostridium sp.]MDU5111196.1 QueT transporter family protein [Clostridium sp.]